MKENCPVNQVSGRGFVPIPAMLLELSFLYQLIQNVFDLLASAGSRIEVFQYPLEIHPSIGRLLYVSNQFLFTNIRRFVLCFTPTGVPCPHSLSLLTSQIEEHRF